MQAKVEIKYKDGSVETNKYASQQKYDKANTVKLSLKLNKKTDEDVLTWLNSQESKQGAIKKLIRKAIKEKEPE